MNQKTLTKKALVIGGGGFIGSHMVDRLKSEGYWVAALDIKRPEFSQSEADRFVVADARSESVLDSLLLNDQSGGFHEIYQFAADMGGAGYIFTGEHDTDVMVNSAGINISLVNTLIRGSKIPGFVFPRIFYSSSACIYPQEIQTDSAILDLKESAAYPANPDSEYGWEKLFSERLFLAFSKNFGCEVRVARFHNIYGPNGTFQGGREKAPAAICRKVIAAEPGGEVEIWGDGTQTRSFLFIDDCIEAVRRFMSQEHYQGPLNIGSEEMVSISELVKIACEVEGKNLSVKPTAGPVGVQGRNSNNDLVRQVLQWDYSTDLRTGITKTYHWIKSQLSMA